MRIIKLAFISFVILFGIITLISSLIPSHIRISRAINLNAGGDSILAIIADKSKLPLWHPAFEHTNDSAQIKWRKETEWKLLTKNDSLVVVQLEPKGKKPVVNGWQLYRYKNSELLTLQWYLDFQLKWYPWQKFSSLFYEATYGAMMEKGLNNLKNMVQK